jgi:hypothetical protein
MTVIIVPFRPAARRDDWQCTHIQLGLPERSEGDALSHSEVCYWRRQCLIDPEDVDDRRRLGNHSISGIEYVRRVPTPTLATFSDHIVHRDTRTGHEIPGQSPATNSPEMPAHTILVSVSKTAGELSRTFDSRLKMTDLPPIAITPKVI